MRCAVLCCVLAGWCLVGFCDNGEDCGTTACTGVLFWYSKSNAAALNVNVVTNLYHTVDTYRLGCDGCDTNYLPLGGVVADDGDVFSFTCTEGKFGRCHFSGTVSESGIHSSCCQPAMARFGIVGTNETRLVINACSSTLDPASCTLGFAVAGGGAQAQLTLTGGNCATSDFSWWIYAGNGPNTPSDGGFACWDQDVFCVTDTTGNGSGHLVATVTWAGTSAHCDVYLRGGSATFRIVVDDDGVHLVRFKRSICDW